MTFSKLGTDIQTNQRVELPQPSRREGLYIIGATGTGKSTLLENLILQDIDQQIGVCVLDPHGDLVNAVISRMKKRLEDVILIDLGSEDYVTGLNLFHCEHPEDPFEAENVVQAVMHILEKVYQISRDTPLMNQYFINITRTLIYNPQATVLDIPRLLTDAAFRGSLLVNVPDDDVQWFWTELYEQQRRGRRSDEILSMVTDKLVEFNSPVLKPWFGQNTQTLNLRRIMDERKILLVKLKARWQSMTSLIGSIFIAQILDAAYSRENIMQQKRKQFNVYADEFQTFASQDFAQLFTEARKYGIGITISHQVFEQLNDTIKATIKQAANIVVFRVSSDNAKEIAGEFDCTPPPGELIYEKMMQEVREIDNTQWWEPPEAELAYRALEEQLHSLEQQVAQLQERSTKWQKAIPWCTDWRQRLLPADVLKLFPAAMTPDLWSLAEFFMGNFLRPDYDDPEVAVFYRSFYEEEIIPLTFVGVREGYIVKRYNPATKQYDVRTANQDAEDQDPNVTYLKQSWDKLEVKGRYWRRSSKPLIYARVRLRPNRVQPGVAYVFPVHFPCLFERMLQQATGLTRTFLEELQQFYEPYKSQARYYFNFERYERDYTGNSLDIDRYFGGIDDKKLKYHFHWNGPYFRSDADWLSILKWFYNQVAKFRLQLTPIAQQASKLQAQLEEMKRQHYREGSQQIVVGYRPVQVTIEEYKRWRDTNIYLPTDVAHDLYRVRQGNPPYGSDEVERRIANQIKSLPKFTARVRIASGEHTITTEKPSGYSNEQELQKRILAIYDQNKNVYVRLRSDVEAELVQRRKALRV